MLKLVTFYAIIQRGSEFFTIKDWKFVTNVFNTLEIKPYISEDMPDM